MHKIKIQKGFTLIELLVVVSIIGFLSTLIVISVGDSRSKSIDTNRITDVFDIQKAMELFASDQGYYPVGDNIELGTANYACLSEDGYTGICPPGKKVYMSIVPANPANGGAPYMYTRSLDGQNYTLTFAIETDIGDVSAGAHTLTPAGVDD